MSMHVGKLGRASKGRRSNPPIAVDSFLVGTQFEDDEYAMAIFKAEDESHAKAFAAYLTASLDETPASESPMHAAYEAAKPHVQFEISGSRGSVQKLFASPREWKLFFGEAIFMPPPPPAYAIEGKTVRDIPVVVDGKV